jgi:peptidoglycan hydrolase-like protein with peptidoglycan-binding domain
MGFGDCGDAYGYEIQPVSAGRRLAVSVAIVLTLGLAGCVPAKMGPTVQVMPGTGKSFEVFQADQAVCEQYANDQVAGARKEANQQAVGTALLGTALGAGLGAAAGSAGTGAAAGAVVGTGIAAGNAQQAGQTIQQQYDNAYSQCMYSRGEQVPGFEPAPPPPVAAAPAPPPKPMYDKALVSGIQTELVRIGLYSGTPDGQFGGRTRGAIKDFQKLKGLPEDGIPTTALLDKLKSS